MIKGRVIYVFDEDFIGSGRALKDLVPEAFEQAAVAHLVIHDDRILKDRLHRIGVIVPPREA